MVACLGSSGVVSAVWDRAGGNFCGPDGAVTKEWSWLSGSSSKERVLIQVRVEGKSVIFSFFGLSYKRRSFRICNSC